MIDRDEGRACRVAIVEDEPLIALDIETAVEEAGCIVAGSVTTLTGALELLSEGQCDGVIFDANLGGVSAAPLSEWLKAQRIPFLVVSGYTLDQIDFLDENAPLVGKPFAFEHLVAAIRMHIRQHNQ